MPELFREKLGLVLKVLSLSRGRLAADLGVDKSVVGRWAAGTVRPSGHNLARLTALIAQRTPGFTALDWDRSPADLAIMLGAAPDVMAALAGTAHDGAAQGLPIAILDQIKATTGLRGAAYEGFFRSTRPYFLQPGRFLHDHGMIRLTASGLLQMRMKTGGTNLEGWMLPLHNQLFVVVADLTSGALQFGLFNGTGAHRAEVLDGLVLGPALDTGRTPAAFAMYFERIGDLSGDEAADDARFEQMAAGSPLAPEGSVSQALRDHLLRDVGPAAFALGGDMLLCMPIARSLARGPTYEGAPTGET